MSRKLLFTLLVVLTFLLNTIGSAAQADPCSQSAVVASFAEAVAQGNVEAWVETYAASDCPPAIKDAARGFADTYNAIPASPATPNPTESSVAASTFPPTLGETTIAVPISGDSPVFEAANSLGFTLNLSQVNARAVDDANDSDVLSAILNHWSYNDFLIMRDSSSPLYVVFPIKYFRHVEQQGDQNVITFADGQAIEAQLITSLEDYTTNNSADLRYDAVTLVSLPKEVTETEYNNTLRDEPNENVKWELHLGAPINRDFTVMDPSFATNTRMANCIGACGGASVFYGGALTLELNGQSFDQHFEDFQAISIGSDHDTVHFTGIQGNIGDAQLSLQGYSIMFTAAVVDSPYSVAVALRNVDEISLRRAKNQLIGQDFTICPSVE